LSHAVDVSVIVPFSDDEEVIGRLARRIARHLHSLHLDFELFCVDEGSSDNSVALLGWLQKHDVPELRLCSAEPGRGFATASAQARGRVLWLLDLVHAEAPLSAFAWAHSRLAEDHADIVIVSRRFVLARRARAWSALEGLRGRGAAFEARLRRRARFRGLRVEGALGDYHAHLLPAPLAPARAERAALWSRVRGLYAASPTRKRHS
jgi:glycosyltransferase involved in cell wall biosynthesis